MKLTIELTDAQYFALQTVAADPAEFADAVVTNRARVAKEELKTKPEWTKAAVELAKEGGNPDDDWAILLQGRDHGLFLTAAQISEAALAAITTGVLAEVENGVSVALVDQQFVLRKMALAGAESREHLDEIIQRGMREGMALMQAQSKRELTDDEQTRAAELEQFNMVMTAMESARDAIKSDVVDGSITTIEEIQTDARWPST